ncbi:MAG: exonuclease SbcCD subunit D [Selenomonadaceae bacterium]|nr:exonuclease SbcCD subunit D [Selenomonadaceae bacterium]
MRFLHTADWHLGKLFGQRYQTEDQRYVLEELLSLVKEAKADAVVVAGDIYDRGVPPAEAVDLMSEVLARFVEKHIPVLYIAGNHDSASRIDFGRSVMEQSGVYVRGKIVKDAEPVVLEDAHGPVYFSLLPFAAPPEVRETFGIERTISYDEAMEIVVQDARAKIPTGARSVAIAHAFLAGGQSAESERPLSVGGSDQVRPVHFKGYSYTALGHLHGPQRAGGENIRYSGSLLKYSFDEAKQQKGASIVDLAADGTVKQEFVPLVPRHDVRIVTGTLAELRTAGFDPLPHDDYVRVDLLDTDTILNAYDKLQAIYPNLFALTRPNWKAKSADELAMRGQEELRKKSGLALFGDFFAEMTDEALTEEQEQVLVQCFDELEREGREDV